MNKKSVLRREEMPHQLEAFDLLGVDFENFFGLETEKWQILENLNWQNLRPNLSNLIKIESDSLKPAKNSIPTAWNPKVI